MRAVLSRCNDHALRPYPMLQRERCRTLEQQLSSSQEALRRLRAAGLGEEAATLITATLASPGAPPGARMVTRGLDGQPSDAGAGDDGAGTQAEAGDTQAEAGEQLAGGAAAPALAQAAGSGEAAASGADAAAGGVEEGAAGEQPAGSYASPQLQLLRDADLSAAVTRAQRAESAWREAEAQLAQLRRKLTQVGGGRVLGAMRQAPLSGLAAGTAACAAAGMAACAVALQLHRLPADARCCVPHARAG
jgi:hypothetical protein